MISGLNASTPRYRALSAQPAARPVASQAPSPDTAQVAIQAGGGVSATGVLDTLKSMFSAVVGFFTGLWNKLFKKNEPGPVDENVRAIAAQYGLQCTKENVDAFVAEVQGYGAPGPGGYQTMGPGSTNVEGVRSIQTALKGWGYALDVTGQFDAATQNAVKAFKKDNGLHQTYKLADGNFAVNEYLDYATYQKMQAKATGQTGNTGSTGTTGNNGTLNWQVMATQYKLFPSEANVQAFMAEVATYQKPDANGFQVMGPGYPNQAQVKEVQAALAKLGNQVAQTGVWDAATAQAVMAFKAKYGIHQNYKATDGNWAINEYADFATLQKISSLV